MAHTRTNKLAKCLAVLAVGLFSIFCVPDNTFTTVNNTAFTINLTLNYQSSGSQQIMVVSGMTVPTDIGTETMAGITLYGVFDSVGVNMSVAFPLGGYIATTWDGGGTQVTLDYRLMP